MHLCSPKADRSEVDVCYRDVSTPTGERAVGIAEWQMLRTDLADDQSHSVGLFLNYFARFSRRRSVSAIRPTSAYVPAFATSTQ